jgi:hypothetical protein
MLFAAIVAADSTAVAVRPRDCFPGAPRTFPTPRAGISDNVTALHKQRDVLQFFAPKLMWDMWLRLIVEENRLFAAELPRLLRMSW